MLAFLSLRRFLTVPQVALEPILSLSGAVHLAPRCAAIGATVSLLALLLTARYGIAPAAAGQALAWASRCAGDLLGVAALCACRAGTAGAGALAGLCRERGDGDGRRAVAIGSQTPRPRSGSADRSGLVAASSPPSCFPLSPVARGLARSLTAKGPIGGKLTMSGSTGAEIPGREPRPQWGALRHPPGVASPVNWRRSHSPWPASTSRRTASLSSTSPSAHRARAAQRARVQVNPAHFADRVVPYKLLLQAD